MALSSVSPLHASASTPLLLPSIRTDHVAVPSRPIRSPGTKIRTHMSCQTEVSEISELRTMQNKLQALRQELTSVNKELHSTEQRLRHEMQLEMEARMRMLGERCTQKVAQCLPPAHRDTQ